MNTVRAMLLAAGAIPTVWLAFALSASAAVSAQAIDVPGGGGQQPLTARGELWIAPARNSYTIGQPVNVCFTVPATGSVVLTDVLPDGSSWDMINQWRNAGTQCVSLWPGPTAGRQCVRLLMHTNLGAGSRQICFQAVSR